MLKVGGVPEHFNEPWLEVERQGLVEFKSYPGGTGAMIEALSLGEVDCALLLTEGAVKYCVEKPDECKVFGVYVNSPLVWGIHCGAGSELTDPKDFSKVAISRFGSGSHLMAFVLAKQLGMKLDSNSFDLVGNLAGAKTYLGETNPNALFLWEKAMTDPLVQQGKFKRLGVVPTPWPCFVLCVRRDVDLTRVYPVWQAVNQACLKFMQNSNNSTVDFVINKFGIRQQLVEEWLQDLRYFDLTKFNDVKMLHQVRMTLEELGQLQPNNQLSTNELILN
ncbi:hypothetical protein BASA81_004757 [Batrachochytrium salamandrivorans]|nr:hypothetical protein BASA81_004757 [Batrachochytrium salamandrivorans]